MMANLRAHICFLLSFPTLMICHNHLPKIHVALFIFGDSLFDPGNNNYINTTFDFQANFWPYGETFFNYPTGRFSDGRLIPDFIAQFAGLPIIPTYLEPGNHKFTDGVNFASGGAGALVESHRGFEIYMKGGRKFGFPNIMPLGCLPYMKAQTGGSCIDELTAIAKLHNKELPKTLQRLEKQLEGFKYAYYNFYESVSKRLNNPSKYGFKDATTACCGSGVLGGVYSCGGKRGTTEFHLCENPGEYFFFDSYHPSEKAYQQFAEIMWSGTTDIVWPYNLKTLFEAKTSNLYDQFIIPSP
ncbi:hypothetical protein REPUB_Repub01dG0162500 [Reevesia pubescens]